MKSIFLLVCVVMAFASFSQKEANIWHFGKGLSLDFNGGTPIQTSGSQIYTFEGSASYCDQKGKLLFYSNGGGRIPASVQDGGKIWNKNNQLMHDMQGIEGGSWDAAQSSVIVPAPGEPHVFYLFTMEEGVFYADGYVGTEPNGRGMRYFKIDMSLNGGLGEVIEADVPVYDYSYEGICAIRHANGTDYWILINQDTSGIGVYSVTQNGVQLDGVYPCPVFYDGMGIIKSSPTPSGMDAPCCNKVMTKAGIYDFNLSTGALSFESDFGAESPRYFEFSPNGVYLYVIIGNEITGAWELIQFNVVAASQTGVTIESTAQVIDQNFNGEHMQLAPDGKIYYTVEPILGPGIGFTTSIGSINCPNTSSPTITSNVFTFTGQLFCSLPNFPSWIFYKSSDAQIQFGPDTVYLCPGETLLLDAGDGNSWIWGGAAASNSTQYYTVTTPGIYSAKVSGPCGLGSDQIVVLPCSNEGPTDGGTFNLSFPNVITPNSDGMNDLFEIQNLPENSEVSILNRWGNVVFSAANYQNNWDGKDTSGKELLTGVYTYYYKTQKGEVGHGFVHLVR